MESSDDGLTWGSMVDITETVVLPAWSFIGTGPPGGIQLPSGRLIICMSCYNIKCVIDLYYQYRQILQLWCRAYGIMHEGCKLGK